MSEYVISAKDLVKQFKIGKKVVTAVDGLSLQVGAGEMLDRAGCCTAVEVRH